MRFLVLDPVSEPVSVQLLEGDGVLKTVFALTISPRQQLSEKLLPTILSALAKQHWPAASLNLIGVVNKGGSFTSVRIALSVANALGYATGRELVALDQSDLRTTDAIAAALKVGQREKVLLPRYDRPAFVVHEKSATS